ncbi:putative ORF-2 [uncultured Candidatus Thioglobus sp.]|nr:putative ORF-2 [uncultured Candidatus Thioglobus sp.]SMN01482.1 putative ORF-2 [uncultured Candidatus Thioglobus sp.]
MPEISRFLGIKILMFFNEHNPPHFHAQYNLAIDIKPLV